MQHRAQIAASAAARSSRARLVSVVHRGERLTTENYVENLENVMVSCLNRFQLPQQTADTVWTVCSLCVFRDGSWKL